MGLRISSNLEAVNAHRNLSRTSALLAKSMSRLSSGLRVNSAADDAAGLGISERMRAQISGLEQASRNAQDGISFVQTAEGGLEEVHSILNRVRDLAVQYNNGTNDAQSLAAITSEVAQLSSEMSRLIASSSFNGIPLLCGNTTSAAIMATIQIGANAGEILSISAVAVNERLGTALFDFANLVGSTANIAAIDSAIDSVSSARSMLGSVQNRLEHAVNYMGVYRENLTAAESRIRDVDMAAEMTTFTKLQILQQTGTAMLAQANAAPQVVLQLLRG